MDFLKNRVDPHLIFSDGKVGGNYGRMSAKQKVLLHPSILILVFSHRFLFVEKVSRKLALSSRIQNTIWIVTVMNRIFPMPNAFANCILQKLRRHESNADKVVSIRRYKLQIHLIYLYLISMDDDNGDDNVVVCNSI